MKNIKWLSLILGAFAFVAFSAFSITNSNESSSIDSEQIVSKKVSEQWEFIGVDDTEAVDAGYYRKLNGTPTFDCDLENATVCTILAEEDPQSDPMDPRPLFSSGTNPVSHPGSYSVVRRSIQP